MKHTERNTLLLKWNFYSEPQKKAILEDFRRKFPDDYYSKEHLILFLKDRFKPRAP